MHTKGSCCDDTMCRSDYLAIKAVWEAEKAEMLGTLEAIKALINGEWDNPSLLKMGGLLPSETDNILYFTGNAIRKAKGNQEMSDARKTLVSFAMLGAAFKGE